MDEQFQGAEPKDSTVDDLMGKHHSAAFRRRRLPTLAQLWNIDVVQTQMAIFSTGLLILPVVFVVLGEHFQWIAALVEEVAGLVIGSWTIRSISRNTEEPSWRWRRKPEG